MPCLSCIPATADAAAVRTAAALKGTTILGYMAAVELYAHNLTLPEEKQVWTLSVSNATKFWQRRKVLEVNTIHHGGVV